MQEQDLLTTGVQFGPWGRKLLALCKLAAILGGIVFVALVVMSIVSIVGRKLFSMPVPGDVELLQTCAAFASATFFGWCHLNQGDVKVDFFTHNWPPRVVHGLDAVGSLLVGLFGALIAWRTAAGALSLRESGEVTMILGWPLWVGQMLMVPGFVLLAAAGLYMAWGHVARAWAGTPARPA
ncbi:MAG: TRAP transporter small permease [Betaproteobacteria bacterium]|nr:TRAP transporter small permease [Betaproteobacteria bacterium]MDE2048742.1 TRAP transporter small permease [Betaproteobacteria bacterium]